MANSKKTILAKHWIIVNHKINHIWKKPYLSLEEAKKELVHQELLLGFQKHGWVIEERESFVEVDDSVNSDGFEKF